MARGYLDEDYGDEQSAKKFLAGGGIIIAVVFAAITFFLGVFKIDETERGIITRYGKFHHVAVPGLNFRIPWVDSLQRIDIRESNPKFADMEMYSSDQFPAKVDGSVILSPKSDNESLATIYKKYGTVENAIRVTFGPMMPAQLKVVFGKYTAQRAIQERGQLNVDARERILTILGENSLFNIKSVPIEDIEFSKKYIDSIEQRMMAEVEVQKVRQNWEREKISADIIRTQADASAYQVKVKGDAEAAAIAAKGKALADNPRYVEMLQAERWDGKLPATMIPGAAIPMLSLPKQQ